jgi:two-component system, NtrC family, sensor kinase
MERCWQGGRSVACRWRIRHKLMLGLALVVGIMALLLAGTLQGLMAYLTTVKNIDSKLNELQAAVDLKAKVHGLRADPESRASSAAKPAKLLNQVRAAEAALGSYRESLQHTLERHRDPDKGRSESNNVRALEESFPNLEKAIAVANEAWLVSGENAGSIVEDEHVKSSINKLESAADNLVEVIYTGLYNGLTDAKAHYRSSLIVVLSMSIVGIVLMAALLRFLYRWVFYPIRDLGLGVDRVAHGDFEHRIEVQSGDEMEDLAAAFNDMTGRLREMYRDLAHQVNERSRQLIRSERLASVGFLAAGVAHEINNPLASIAFCSEALESRMASLLDHVGDTSPQRERGPSLALRASVAGQAAPAKEDGEVITKYLKMIQQEAFRCKAITQRLLEFSRTGERRRESTDLAELIQSVLDVVQHLQNSKGKHIIFEPDGRHSAWINTQEIKSVVLNLVVNALDSMDENGSLTITLGQRDGMAEMRFTDTGCGMTAEVLENIFEPFFTRSRTGKGTGLGLAISHRVITQHGGEIEATSAGLNQGSTFIVRLPIQPAGSVKEETLGHAAA